LRVYAVQGKKRKGKISERGEKTGKGLKKRASSRFTTNKRDARFAPALPRPRTNDKLVQKACSVPASLALGWHLR